jgi:hypothetical protein
LLAETEARAATYDAVLVLRHELVERKHIASFVARVRVLPKLLALGTR